MVANKYGWSRVTRALINNNWAEVHISHRVIVFVFYGKKLNVFGF